MSLRNDIRGLPRVVWVLFAGTVVNRIGTMVLVFLVLYLTRNGYTAPQAGLALASYGVGGLVSSFVGGWLADHIGRRNSIVLSMLSAAVTIMVLAFIDGYWPIVAVTCAVGFTSEMYRPAASALLGDVTRPDQRVTGYAVYRLAINLGAGIGPAIGGYLADISFTYVFVIDAVTCVGFALIAIFALPNHVDHGDAAPVKTPGHAVVVMLRDRQLLVFLAMSTLTAFMFTQVHCTYPLQIDLYGYRPSTFGLLLAINGFLVMAIELWLTTITKDKPPRIVMGIGILLMGVGLYLTGVSRALPFLVGSVVIWTLGEIVMVPVAAAWVTNAAPADMRGRYNGAWVMTWGIANVVGPTLGTAVFAASASYVWLGCLLLSIVSSALAMFLRPNG